MREVRVTITQPAKDGIERPESDVPTWEHEYGTIKYPHLQDQSLYMLRTLMSIRPPAYAAGM